MAQDILTTGPMQLVPIGMLTCSKPQRKRLAYRQCNCQNTYGWNPIGDLESMIQALFVPDGCTCGSFPANSINNASIIDNTRTLTVYIKILKKINTDYSDVTQRQYFNFATHPGLKKVEVTIFVNIYIKNSAHASRRMSSVRHQTSQIKILI